MDMSPITGRPMQHETAKVLKQQLLDGEHPHMMAQAIKDEMDADLFRAILDAAKDHPDSALARELDGLAGFTADRMLEDIEDGA